MSGTHAGALREFLLVLERPKQPLDAAFLAFTDLLRSSPATAARLLAIHPQCEPLLHCWPETVGAGTRWEQRESVAVFLEALALLLRAQTAQDASVAETLALKVIHDRSAHLEKVMTWSDKPLIEFRALELVRALVAVSGAVAREFVRLFNLQSPAFVKMATRRFKKPEPAPVAGEGEEEEAGEDAAEPQKPSFQIREAYVHLVLELTACPDKSVHRFALKEGGVTVSLFKSVDGDSPDILALIFDKLEELVLRNEALDFRAKTVVWSGASVLQLLPLLQSDDEQVVARTAAMLDTLFFADGALYEARSDADAFRAFLVKPGSASTPNTQRSRSFEQSAIIKTVKSTVVAIGVNELLRSPAALDVATKFMTKYPSLIADYLAVLSIPLEPRPGYRWFCVASLLQKLLSCPITASAIPHDDLHELDEKEVGDARSSWCSPQLLATRLIAPFNYRKELSRGIQHTNDLIVYSILGVIEAILRRFECVVMQLMPTAHQAHSALESDLRFLLPSPEALVSLLLKLCGTESASPLHQSTELIYVRALSVFRLYVECFPQTMREVKLDFSKLLRWRYLDGGDAMSDEAKPSLQRMIVAETLRFLFVIDGKRLSFLLHRGGSGSNGAAGPSKLLQLLLLDVTTPSRTVQQLCDKVIARVLLVSGVFGRQNEASSVRESEEVAFWLQSLHQGGRACAQFVEELVQSVSSDPFANAALYHAHVQRAVGAKRLNGQDRAVGVSPITTSLVVFLNASKSAEGSDWWTAYRRDATVVLFAVRVLLSVLHSAGPDARPLVSLIASGATAPTPEASTKDGSESGDDGKEVATRKRKRAGDVHTATSGAEDSYSWLKAYCKSQLAHPTAIDCATSSKKAKADKNGALDRYPGWKKAPSVDALRHQLASLPPTAFGHHWEAIVGNCEQLDGSFDTCYHYLYARADADVMPALSAVTPGAAKKGKKTGGKADIAAHPFVQTLSPVIVLQHLLYRLSRDSSRDSAVSSAITQLSNMVKQRASSEHESLVVEDALRMCDQLFFFFAMDLNRDEQHQHSVESRYKPLCALLHLLLTFTTARKGEETIAPSAQRRVSKLERLIAQYSAAPAAANASRDFVRRRLVAIRSTLAALQPISLDDASASETGRLLARSAAVPLLVVGALDARSSRQSLLAMLSSLLVRQHRRYGRRDAQCVLIARIIRCLSDAIDMPEASTMAPAPGLARRLWRFLTTSTVSADEAGQASQREAVEVLDSGLELLGRLGGIDASSVDIERAVSSSIAPAVVHEAAMLVARASAGDSPTAPPSPQVLPRVVRALAFRVADGGAAGLAESLEAHVLARLKAVKDERVACVVVASVLDVLGRVRTAELGSFVARSLVPRVVEALLFPPHAPESASRALDVHAALLRRWSSSEPSDPSSQHAAVDALTSVLSRLCASHPSGVAMSRAQLLCVLALVRSWSDRTRFPSGSAAPAPASPRLEGEGETEAAVAAEVVALLTRSAARSLLDASDSTAATECCQAAGLVAELFLARTRLLDGSAVLTELLPVFQSAVASAAASAERRVFTRLVALSSVLLRLAAAAREPVAYDFARHLAAVADHACLAPSLQDAAAPHARAQLVRVLAGLLERGGAYRPSLLAQLLGAYSMSLSPLDRSLRALVARFERQQRPDASLARLGFRFGAAAASASAAALAARRADLVEDAQWLVGGGLEPARVRATVDRFPLARGLDAAEDEALLSWRCWSPPASAAKDEGDADADERDADGEEDAAVPYDPAFLLPMLAHFVSASALTEDALLHSGLLGLALRATSAADERVRALAFGVLAHVREAAAAAGGAFRAGRQVLLLLDAFRRALAVPRQRAPSLATVFLNDALWVLARPAHAMYAPVNAFLLARPALDLQDVPMFLALLSPSSSSSSSSFHNHNHNHLAANPAQRRQERAWLLHALRRGVREDEDARVLARRHALPQLLALFAAPALADAHTQALVLRVLLAAAATPAGCALLRSKCAAVEWIAAQIPRVAKDADAAADASALRLLLALLRRLAGRRADERRERDEQRERDREWAAAVERQTADALAAARVAASALRHSPIGPQVARAVEAVAAVL